MQASAITFAFGRSLLPFGIALLLGGCEPTPQPPPPPRPSASIAQQPTAAPAPPEPTVSGAPIALRDVEAATNPGRLPPYDGPTGILEGSVRIAGDPAPEVPLTLPASCTGAERTYGRLFREGENRAAADVLIAVTGYRAYIPVRGQAVTATIKDCAFSARTFSMTFGQHMEVENLDETNSYIPVLQGSRFTAFSVAVPKGREGKPIKSDPVRLYPHRVGQYELADNMNRPWMSADVFVLKYPTHTVTGIDGRFRLEGIPVGDVQVDALLPSADLSESKKITISAGKTTELDLVLRFDQKTNRGKTRPHPIQSAAASSTPTAADVK